MAISPNPKLNRNSEDEPDMEQRNWAELNGDVLMMIFQKVGTVSVLLSAGSVCRTWREVAKEEPELWRRIDMTHRSIPMALLEIIRKNGVKRMKLIMTNLAKIAIDRSRGRLEELWLQYFGDNDLLQYLCDRTNVLKSLRLLSCGRLKSKKIVEMAKRQPLLEELEITDLYINSKLPELVGEALPNLKQLKLNHVSCNFPALRDYQEDFINATAFGIAKTMHQLRSLQLIRNGLTNKGLKTILEGCPNLETLEIHGCVNMEMDSDMRARCARLTNFSISW